MGFPNQVFFDSSGNFDTTVRRLTTTMGSWAGLAYCPAAFLIQRSSDPRAGTACKPRGVGCTFLEWAMTADLDALKDARDWLITGNPAFPKAYRLTQTVHDALKHQFPKQSGGSSLDKVEMCFAAIVSMRTRQPTVGSMMLEHDGALRWMAPNFKFRELQTCPNLQQLSRIEVTNPIPDHMDSLVHPTSVHVVWEPKWGLQAVVFAADVPSLKPGAKVHDRAALSYEPGIVVAFRGTTSNSLLQPVYASLRSGQSDPRSLIIDADTPEDEQQAHGYHQWVMNLRNHLVDIRDTNKGLGLPDVEFPVADFNPKTIEGITTEARTLVHPGPAPNHGEPKTKGVGSVPPDKDWSDGSVIHAINQVVEWYGRHRGAAKLADIPIVVTGHSKGGALSILGSYLIAEHLNVPHARVRTVISVEGPRTGNPAWAQQYLARMRKHDPAFNFFRIVKKGDPVSEEPFPRNDKRVGVYAHVPGLLSVPVMTMLDVIEGPDQDVIKVQFPPIFVCDLRFHARAAIEADFYRPQLGSLKPKHQDGRDLCINSVTVKTALHRQILAQQVEGSCRACWDHLGILKLKRSSVCRDLGYKDGRPSSLSDGTAQAQVASVRQTRADRAQVDHYFFGPNYQVNIAAKSVIPQFTSTVLMSAAPPRVLDSYHPERKSRRIVEDPVMVEDLTGSEETQIVAADQFDAEAEEDLPPVKVAWGEEPQQQSLRAV
jgi:hypothetical protein